MISSCPRYVGPLRRPVICFSLRPDAYELCKNAVRSREPVDGCCSNLEDNMNVDSYALQTPVLEKLARIDRFLERSGCHLARNSNTYVAVIDSR